MRFLIKKCGVMSQKMSMGLVLLGIGISVGICLSGCAPKDPLLIGVLGTMTGSNSDLSVSGRRGLELAVTDINASGGINGRRLELVIKDDLNTPETAVTAIKELHDEGVNIVIGPYTSGMAMSIFDEINALKMLTLAPTVSADALSGKADYFVRFIASTKEQAEVLSQVAKVKDHKKIAVVYDIRNHGFTEQLLENYKILIQSKLGLDVQSMAYNPTIEKEVALVHEWIKTQKPEGLFVIASAEECAKMAQSMKLTLPSLQLYGPLWANTPELIHKGGKAVEGMMVVGGLDLSNTNRTLMDFRKKYFDQYGVEFTFASAYSYEALMALRQALENVKTIDTTAVRDEMISLKKFEGLQQAFEIDAYGDNTRAYLIYEVKNGELKKVE